MKIRLLIAAIVIAVGGLLAIETKSVQVAAQHKELPLPCPPFCPVLKQDVAWIQHRIAGHDRD